MADAATFVATKVAQLRLMARVPREAVRPVADVVKREIDAQLAAGTDPLGEPWPEKAGGGKALRDIGKHLVVGILGQTIIVRIKARHIVLHHFGYARGRKKRQVLPSDGIPPKMARAIDVEIYEVAQRIAEAREQQALRCTDRSQSG